MSRQHFTHYLITIALALLVAVPDSVAKAEAMLGNHTAIAGDTLYCLGRAYGVVPSAIAKANGLGAQARLRVGQVLAIPDVQWAKIPAGPVCVVQFTSPYASQSPTTTTATPTPTTTGAGYLVKRGDTLWRISRTFGVTVNEIKAANNLRNDVIYVGQVLVIPGTSVITSGTQCDPSYPTVCIKSPPPDLDCEDVGLINFAVSGNDPHGFDGDNDGVGCEPPPNCDPAYPDVCIPSPPPDLDCGDIPFRNFRVLAPDPHGFDGNDNDGIGCEG